MSIRWPGFASRGGYRLGRPASLSPALFAGSIDPLV
jgi:hypothetical protein